MRKRRFFESIVCFILALALMCPMGIETKAAETNNVETIEVNDSDADDILNLDLQLPEEFYDYNTLDVYGSKSAPFLLSEQNELFLYRTLGNPKDKDSKAQAWYYKDTDMTIKNSNPGKGEYFVNSINNTNSGYKGVGVSKDGFAYVEGVGFDPLENGRKKYAGYVGYKDKSLYCFVIEANSGKQWAIKLNSMNWVDTYDPDYWQVANYFSITAGDFNGDKKETLIVCGIGDGSNLNVYEVSFDGKKLTSKTVLNLASTKTSTNEPILYDDVYKYVYKGNPNLKTPYGKDEKKYILRSRPNISLTAGDFDGDGKDELAFATGYNKARGGAKDGYTGNASNVEGFATTVGITDLEGDKWSNPVTFYMYERTGSPKINGKQETYNLKIMHQGALTAADNDGDGVDEIVVVGYTSYDDIANATYNVSNVKEGNKTVKKYQCTKVNHIGDFDKSNYVTSVIVSSKDSKGKVTYSRTDLNKLNMTAFNKDSFKHLHDNDFVFAPITMASASTNGKNLPEDVFIAGSIYNFESQSAELKYSPNIMTQTFGHVFSWESVKTSVFWVDNVAAGNFDHNDGGREQFVYTVWFKKNGSDTNYAFMGITGGAKYDDKMDGNGNITSYGTCSQYGNSDIKAGHTNVLWSSNRDSSQVLTSANGKYCNAVPVAVDTIDDGIMAKFKGAAYAYTDPEVIAVLEAAPYFEECQEPGSLSYTITNGSGRSKSEGWDVSFNVGFSGESELRLGGKAKVGVEAGVTNGFSKTFTDSYSVSESTTITATDKTSVIVNRTPYMIYLYDIKDNKTGKWIENSYAVSVQMSPVMFALSIDDYNDLVDKYNTRMNEADMKDAPRLSKLVEDNKMIHKDHEGDPFAYTTKLFKKPLVSKSGIVSTNNGSTGATWSYEKSHDEEYVHSHGFYVSMTVQWGVDILIYEAQAGFNVGLEANWSFGETKTTFSGTEISAEVSDLNSKAMKSKGFTNDQITAYGFTWQLGKWEAYLNGNTKPAVPVYGFYTTNVTAPPAPVNDLEADFDVDKDGKRVVNLSWSDPGDAKRPSNGYIVYKVDDKGKKTKIEDVADTNYVYKNVGNEQVFSFAVKTKGKGTLTSGYSNIATASILDKAIYDIKLTKKENGKNIYTVFYNDGSTETLEIMDGQKGEKGDKGDKGDNGSGTPGTPGAQGAPGATGASAYEIAVANGFTGTEAEWLAALKGNDGTPGTPGAAGAAGKSAYEIAVANGYTGSETEWLASLEGTPGTAGAAGKSAYEIAVANGYTGSETEWLASLKGTPGTAGAAGKSAYEIAVANGFTGTETEWLASLKGEPGKDAVASGGAASGGSGSTGSCKINTTVTVTEIGEGMGVLLTFNDLGFSISFSGDGIELSDSNNNQLLYVAPFSASAGD